MTKTLRKPRLFSNKLEQKPKPQVQNNSSKLPPNLKSFKQKFLSGSGFVENK